MSDEQIYGFMPFNHADRPVEAMVGETVYDYNGKVLGWIVSEQAIAAWNARADEFGADDDYERRMDELLCRLTNGKWSKSRSYSVDFMASCVDEAYEDAYEDSTFDRGECEDVWRYDPYAAFKCSACGTSRIELDKRAVRFCSNCGRRVKGGV